MVTPARPPSPVRAAQRRAPGRQGAPGRIRPTGRLTPAGHATLDALELDAVDARDEAGAPPPVRPEPSVRRMLRRRRRTVSLAVLLLAAALVFMDLSRAEVRQHRSAEVIGPPAGPAPAGPSATPSTAPFAFAVPSLPALSSPLSPPSAGPDGPDGADGDAGGGTQGRAVTFPITGQGTFRYATGTGAVLGAAGTLRRFRVAVERGSGQDAARFARMVERILADPRGWTASRRLRLQRVPAGVPAHFTVFLATPGTSETMCAVGGLRTERFTNCRVAGRVVINLARWWQSVPGYGASLAVYRTYAVNHEVGHELGYGHEACPGRGRTAPVMQQQTLGLRGCRANGWPYRGGRRYAGVPIP